MITNMLVPIIFIGGWLGFMVFMIFMTLTNGGLSDGQVSYGNLLGLIMWTIIGGAFALPTLLVFRKKNDK